MCQLFFHGDVSNRNRGRNQAWQEKRVELLFSWLHKSAAFIAFTRPLCVLDLCPQNFSVSFAPCLAPCCSLPHKSALVCAFFFPPVLQLVECLQPALYEECSRFRKITRGESLTHSSCCVTKGSYQFTTESRLGGTAAKFRSSQVEETRNCD